ncbi:MAG: hypothetical protein AAF799_14610 [Myxococcota bacterium]
MRKYRQGLTLALGWLLVGCGDDGGSVEMGSTGIEASSSSGEEPLPEAPLAIGEIDIATGCALEGATRVELHATRVGCVNPPPAPCTVTEPPRSDAGEGVDCPAAASETLYVEIPMAGRYHFEAVTLAGEEELSRECYGRDGEAEVLVTADEIEQNVMVAVESLDGSAC